MRGLPVERSRRGADVACASAVAVATLAGVAVATGGPLLLPLQAANRLAAKRARAKTVCAY